jgi:hypothetical protein
LSCGSVVEIFFKTTSAWPSLLWKITCTYVRSVILIVYYFLLLSPNFGLIYMFLTEKRYTLQTLDVLSKRLHVQMHTRHTLNVLWILIPITSKVRKIYTWVISKENASNANKR